MSALSLVIGNKAYSSWSLRPWLVLRQAGLSFAEIVIPLRQPDTATRIGLVSAAGKVPVLLDGDLVVWESLAICEYVAERAPGAGLWPAESGARAIARSVAQEMHAGFPALRRSMPMDLRQRLPGAGRTPECLIDIARVTALWRSVLDRTARAGTGADGPFLFGGFTIADAMFAPVCTRFATYGVELDPVSHAYQQAVLALPAMQEWTQAAAAEPWVIDFSVGQAVPSAVFPTR